MLQHCREHPNTKYQIPNAPDTKYKCSLARQHLKSYFKLKKKKKGKENILLTRPVLLMLIAKTAIWTMTMSGVGRVSKPWSGSAKRTELDSS